MAETLSERLREKLIGLPEGFFRECGPLLHEAADAIERLQKALEPFAKAGNSTSAQYADLDGALSGLTISDLRAAADARRAALSSPEPASALPQEGK